MNTSKVLLFLITIFTLLFIISSSLSAEITEPIRDGDYIYIDDSKAYLKGTYSVSHGEDIEHWAMTKQFTGDCDMAIGFDGVVAWPTKVLLEDPHYIYSETNQSKTFYYVTNFASTTGAQDYGNWYNLLKYKFNHKIFIGYDNATNESIWQDVIGTVAYFDSQKNDGTNYTITWCTEHSRLEQYRDISNRILANPIEYEFDGKNLWFITKNIPMTANEMRKIVIEMDGKMEWGTNNSYKYDIIWKPSHQPISEAIVAGNLYVLDPLWNSSYDIRLKMPINNTAGAGVQTDFQVGTNISAYGANASSLRCYNRTTGNIMAHWNETVVGGNVNELWTNNSVIASGWDNNTFCVWESTSTTSSSSDGDGTFCQYHGLASSNFLDSVAAPYENISVHIRWKRGATTNTWWGLGTHLSDGGGDQLIFKATTPPNRAWYFWKKNNGGSTDIEYAGEAVPPYDTNWHISRINYLSGVATLYVDDVHKGTSLSNDARKPDENMGLGMFSAEGTAEQDWSFVIKNNPTPPVYENPELEHYISSLYYNTTSVLNTIYSSPYEYALNLTPTGKTNTNDTAKSTGLSEIVITNFDNAASIVRNFTLTGDDLDWYQAANLSGSYSMKNSSGTVQTVADGNFTVNLVAGDYWIEQADISIVLLSQTPSIIYTNSTGFINISYGISHGTQGLNNTSVSFIYRNYDYDLSDSNHSIRPPSNDLASEWNLDGRILRAANRNESLNFENNATITGGDTYTWSGLDENSSEINIVPINSTYTKVYINSTVHRVMPQMHYLDRSDLQQAPKTQLAIHKTQNVLIKFWNFEIFKGNYDFLGVGYTDTSLNTNPALWPSDANPVNFYYVNSSYDPATGGDPLTSGYAVYMGSLNASGWTDHAYSPHPNSNYARGFIDNNYLHTVINTTNISYLYFTSNTESSKPYYINMTNVATSTNVSFANTNTLWAGNTPPYTPQAYTPNVWFAFMKLNMSLDHKLYVADNSDLWGSSSMSRTNITQALFPPTTPMIDHFHFLGETDYDMDGVYYGNFSIGCGVSSDPDGGDVTHNLTLHYDNQTFVAIINNTFTDKNITHNGVYFDANFSSIPYYSQTENYTLRLIATDDESESVTVWLGVNFSLDGSPRIISYSPETPVSSDEGENQTFSIITNLPGNVTWYIDSVEVFNETDVNSSSYSNSTALAGVYNVTVVTTNTNGSNSMTWDWTVGYPKQVPLSIYMGIGGVILIMFISSLMYVGIPAIFTSFLGTMLAFINSVISVNGQLVQNISGIDSVGNVVQGTTVIEVPALCYLFIFIGLIMVGLTIYHIAKEFQYKKESEYEAVEF